jgi:hypothetical protein
MAWVFSLHVDLRISGLALNVSASAGSLHAGCAGPLLFSSVSTVDVGSLGRSALSAASA